MHRTPRTRPFSSFIGMHSDEETSGPARAAGPESAGRPPARAAAAAAPVSATRPAMPSPTKMRVFSTTSSGSPHDAAIISVSESETRSSSEHACASITCAAFSVIMSSSRSISTLSIACPISYTVATSRRARSTRTRADSTSAFQPAWRTPSARNGAKAAETLPILVVRRLRRPGPDDFPVRLQGHGPHPAHRAVVPAGQPRIRRRAQRGQVRPAVPRQPAVVRADEQRLLGRADRLGGQRAQARQGVGPLRRQPLRRLRQQRGQFLLAPSGRRECFHTGLHYPPLSPHCQGKTFLRAAGREQHQDVTVVTMKQGEHDHASRWQIAPDAHPDERPAGQARLPRRRRGDGGPRHPRRCAGGPHPRRPRRRPHRDAAGGRD